MANQFLAIPKGLDISWSVATDLIGQYNNHKDRWKTPEGDTLSAFRISVEDLHHVITSDFANQSVKDILIVLGYNDKNIDVNGNGIPDERKGFTAIVIGVDSDNEIIRTGTENIQDYLDTVPPDNNKPNPVDGKDLHEW